MKIEDIAFYVLVLVLSSWIAKELIPDHVKQYWGYLWQTRKDHKAGWFNRKWIWTFRDGVSTGRNKEA